MVSGFFPLDEASKNDWRFVRLQAEQAKGGSSTETVYGWYRRTASHLSPELVDLLDKLLTIDPQRRLTLDAVKEHPWVKKVEAPPNTEVMGDEQPIYRSINVGGSESSPSAAGAADFDEMPVYRSFGGLAGEEEIPMPGLRRQNGNFDLRQGDEIAILGEDPI